MPERIAERTVADTTSLAGVVSRLLDRQESVRLVFNLKEASQEDLMSLLSVVIIDYLSLAKDKNLPLLETLLDAAPANASNPARFYFAFLQVRFFEGGGATCQLSSPDKF